MDLQTFALIASLATPVVTAAVVYGTINGRMDAKLHAAHEKASQAFHHADRAHQRLDNLQAHMSYSQQVIAGLTDIARDYVRSGIRVSVESNILPPVIVYSGRTSSPTGGAVSVAQLLGIRGGVVVRDAKGAELARFGQPSVIQPLRAGLLLLAVVTAGYLIVRAIR